MKVLVHVEGPSDRDALQALLRPIIEAPSARKLGITFVPHNGKAKLLRDAPRRAAEHLRENPKDWAFALPDLYPMAYYGHNSLAEMRQALQDEFAKSADRRQLSEEARARFRVHCLKHDLEALLLAVPELLRDRLDTKDALRGAWRLPVEDQNDHKPPKRIVEELFKKYRKNAGYKDTSDAFWILRRARLGDIERACPQCFAPFVRELRAIAEGQDPDALETFKPT
jgi:hypothetical protein